MSNRKRNTVEMKINQDAAHQGARGVRKYVGPVTVGKKFAFKLSKWLIKIDPDHN